MSEEAKPSRVVLHRRGPSSVPEEIRREGLAEELSQIMGPTGENGAGGDERTDRLAAFLKERYRNSE